MNLRVVPVGLLHGSFEIVDDERFRDTAKVTKRILQRADERFRALMLQRFAVSLSQMTEHLTRQPPLLSMIH